MTRRSGNFFRRLVAGLTLIVVLTSVVSGTLALRDVDESLRSSLLNALDAQATLLLPHARGDFAGATPEELTATEVDLARVTEDLGFRVTFIRRDGTVVVDTEHDVVLMENHTNRSEIQQALESGRGRDIRKSHTLGEPYIYLARVELPESGTHGVIRVASRMSQIEEQVAAARQGVLVGAGLGAVVAILLGLLLAKRLSTPIAQMTVVAEDLRMGKFETRVAHIGSGEIGVLGEALNRLGGELSSKIAMLSADEAQLRAMLAGMVEGVVAVDADDRLVFSNQAARAILGLTMNQANRGTRLLDIARLTGLDTLVLESRASDSAATAQLDLTALSGDRTLLVKAHRYVAHGQFSVVVVLEDVTELRRLETVRRDFVANVSHELKTPLTSIRGFVETLLDGAIDDPEHNRRFLEKVNDSAGRLNLLVADLLSLARIEAQEGSLVMGRVDWRVIVNGSLRRAEAHAKARTVELVAELAEGRHVVSGDEEALTQVVDNLIDNALKYTHEGGKVTVRLEAVGTDRVALEVADTGIGIPAADRERVFERFYRVDKARSRELGGTGLGLAIVKHLVGAMHGDIDLESASGTGSTFRVTLLRD